MVPDSFSKSKKLKSKHIFNHQKAFSGIYMSKIRVVIADDNKQVRDGLRKMLKGLDEILVVGEASDGEEAIQLVEKTSPDILILDIEMPKVNGYQVVEHFRSHLNPVKILLLSDYDVLDIPIMMFNGGASGYLTKEYAPESLTDAVLCIAAGQAGWLNPVMRQKIAVWKNSLNGEIYMKPEQMQMLFLIIEGKTKQQIAEELNMNESLVALHVQALQKMFGAEDEAELSRLAYRPTAEKVQVYP
jgi:DNA-binding NarL/FixJ family response regulator